MDNSDNSDEVSVSTKFKRQSKNIEKKLFDNLSQQNKENEKPSSDDSDASANNSRTSDHSDDVPMKTNKGYKKWYKARATTGPLFSRSKRNRSKVKLFSKKSVESKIEIKVTEYQNIKIISEKPQITDSALNKLWSNAKTNFSVKRTIKMIKV